MLPTLAEWIENGLNLDIQKGSFAGAMLFSQDVENWLIVLSYYLTALGALGL